MEYCWRVMPKLKEITTYIQKWKRGDSKAQRTVASENKAERDQPNYDGVRLQRLVDHFAKGKSTALNGDNQRKGGAILVSLVVMPGIGKLQKEHQLHFGFGKNAKGGGKGKMKTLALNAVTRALLKESEHVEIS